MKTAWRSSQVSAQIRHLNEQMQSKDQLDTFFFVLITLQIVFICLYFVCVGKLKGQVSW